MLFVRAKAVLLLPAIFLILSTFFLYSSGASGLPTPGGFRDRDGLVSWRRSVVEKATPDPNAIVVDNGSFILASERTHRRDPLDGYKHYNGGWNISNKHYWASVGVTAVPLFLIALIWFVFFGLALLFICCCYCCCRRQSYSYSRTAYALSLIILILFTCAAIVGCVVLYYGQGKFHGSTSHTLKYVVNQANVTVDNLRNFSNNLAAAKHVGVDQIFLPADVQARIDEIETKLNRSANDLSSKTDKNSQKIQDLLDFVRLDLIIVAAVMLFLAFLGFLFSVLGLQFLVYFLVLIGWILVAGTFILCGVFLLLHNVVGDTCVAMDQWVVHPQAHTALDDVLPCVDTATANESLNRSKEVTSHLVNVVNQVITNVSNRNFPPALAPLYYNQSGPLMPVLCNPFAPDMTDRNCAIGEVEFSNASQVWKNYVCQVSSAGICTTKGRVTPKIYNQMVGAVNVSYGLYHDTPFLTHLEDCTFVRDTFATISSTECPSLRRYSKLVYIGLVMVSAAVMLSLIFWVIYARERRHRKYNRQFIQGSGPGPYEGKS
ncbi:uncharacterized protein LOC143879485 [Tasmannia lanceolata]|uniref:uncharacterized protein LOC143879485 n=1 Tax=Tasmannia lanceolata TaxID=3420 RepID=UPI004062AF00